MESLDAKLLRRSIGQHRKHQSIRPLYRDRSWATDLDIVNELGGHTGCVNALSWSTRGHLLASGSDDTYLNIWDYNPTSTTAPFTLNTSVATGHHANIFSVKFMPHSNDRTVVTCAGDSEVRVFDLEYGGSGSGDADGTTSTRSRRFNTFFKNARWLNESNTNARVYRSHSDRAKRIVTESSPHLFLSCSEDGEVRQWDLRQPSSAYPPPAGARRLGRFRTTYSFDAIGADVPPPLISYKKYDLDLNSISCSASQPHYIALGGAHLHCFLHDRRMLGRDLQEERGQPAGRTPIIGSHADNMMRESTKCVRRFAPKDRRRMRPYNSGHITACKISDARPNELISSWSGDHIYSFDIVKSPDARDADEQKDQEYHEIRRRHRIERERKKADGLKRTLQGSSARPETEQYGRAQAIDTSNGIDADGVSLLENESFLTEAEQQAQRVATSLVRLRRTLFDFQAAIGREETADMDNAADLTPFTSNFSEALGQACVLLSDMEDIMREWRYPVNPDHDEVELQNTLRRNRQAAWRFVQAAGVISRTLGGRIKTSSGVSDPQMVPFKMVRPAPAERSTDRRFYYEFIKAILLWLDEGANSVLEGFRKSSGRLTTPEVRFPFDSSDSIDTMPGKLRSILTELAEEEKPILDLDANRFLVDDLKHVFQTQQQGVNAFVRALANFELRIHQGLSEPGIYSAGSSKRVMDKGAAARFWGVKVCRSLLMDAAEGVNFGFVLQAFGGSDTYGLPELESQSEDEDAVLGRTRQLYEAAPLLSVADQSAERDNDIEMDTSPITAAIPNPTVDDAQSDEDMEQSILLEEMDDDNDQGEENHDDNSAQDTDTDDAEEDLTHSLRYGPAPSGRPRARAYVNLDVPFTSHTKTYKGHCNSRTVKDVNYYGLDDEYVVSGSDDGHFFIWDRKTCEIVNILEGDGEVVNVVQGHPYEPMIACSGIDSTVKIFGPSGGSRERYRATKGIDIANPGGSAHSSLQMGGRRRRAQDSDDETEEAEPMDEGKVEAEIDETQADEQLLAKNGLRSRRAIQRLYEITSQNDAERQRGIDDTYITQGMLARFAAALQRGELRGATGQGFGGTGGTIVVDQDNCSVM